MILAVCLRDHKVDGGKKEAVLTSSGIEVYQVQYIMVLNNGRLVIQYIRPNPLKTPPIYLEKDEWEDFEEEEMLKDEYGEEWREKWRNDKGIAKWHRIPKFSCCRDYKNE